MNRKLELATISNIVDRAYNLGIVQFDKLSLMMDLDFTNKSVGLDLQKLFNADNFDFTHDIIGIQNNINRNTGKLENFFLPRCAKSEGNQDE